MVGPKDIPSYYRGMKMSFRSMSSFVFNKTLESERMPEEWKSVLVPIFKNKGDVQSCNNHRGIWLISYSTKL